MKLSEGFQVYGWRARVTIALARLLGNDLIPVTIVPDSVGAPEDEYFLMGWFWRVAKHETND